MLSNHKVYYGNRSAKVYDQCDCQASSTKASFVLYVSKTQQDPK